MSRSTPSIGLWVSWFHRRNRRAGGPHGGPWPRDDVRPHTDILHNGFTPADVDGTGPLRVRHPSSLLLRDLLLSETSPRPQSAEDPSPSSPPPHEVEPSVGVPEKQGRLPNRRLSTGLSTKRRKVAEVPRGERAQDSQEHIFGAGRERLWKMQAVQERWKGEAQAFLHKRGNWPDLDRCPQAKKLYVVSDLHVDFKENMKWLEEMEVLEDGALIVAGDLATSIEHLERSLRMLASRANVVFFCVGNHEMWCTKKDGNSILKLEKIMGLCDQLGIWTTPGRIAPGMCVVPLQSWYNMEFASYSLKDVHLLPAASSYFDAGCKWPESLCLEAVGKNQSHSPYVSKFMMELNEPLKRMDFGGDALVTFSHFIPQKALYRGRSDLEAVMGCQSLGKQVEMLKPKVHIFGHSHMSVDKVINGTRYLQNALGYPRERWRGCTKPTLVWADDVATNSGFVQTGTQCTPF